MLIRQDEDGVVFPFYTFRETTNLDKICQKYGVTYNHTITFKNDDVSKKESRIAFFKNSNYLCVVYRDLPLIYSGIVEDLLNEEEFLSDIDKLLKEQTEIEYRIKDTNLSPFSSIVNNEDNWQPVWLYSNNRPPHDDVWAWVAVREYNGRRELFVFSFPCQFHAKSGYWRYSAGDGSMKELVLDNSRPSDYSHDGYVEYYMPIGYKPNSPEDDCVG